MLNFDREELEREFREMIVPLCEAVAPTGFEEEAEAVVRRFLPAGFELTTDRLHNLIAHKPGKGPKVAVVAHLDEIGLIVRTIDSRGFLWFETLAGVQPQQLFGKHVIVKTENGHVDGVVNHMKPGRPAPCPQMPTALDEFFIDIGAASREEALEMGVEVGSPVALEYPTLFMGKGKQVVAGKALDDRACVYQLIELCRLLAAGRPGFLRRVLHAGGGRRPRRDCGGAEYPSGFRHRAGYVAVHRFAGHGGAADGQRAARGRIHQGDGSLPRSGVRAHQRCADCAGDEGDLPRARARLPD